MQVKKSNSGFWQWLALITVLVNIFFNYYTNVNPVNGLTMGEVSAKYPTLFTPAGYAFSIWGVIYLSFIGYVIYQVLPVQRSKEIFIRLAKPLVATSLLSIAWLISFGYEQLLLSVCIIVLMLVTAVVLFVRSKEAVWKNQANSLISIPFALYAGWLSVATIANTSVWLKGIGWQGGSLGEIPWTLIMIGVAASLGLLISYKRKDIVFPLVVVWASFAIFVARQNEQQTVAITALVASIIVGVWVVGYGIRLVRHKQFQAAV